MAYTSRSALESAIGASTVLDLVDDEHGSVMGATQEARVTAALALADDEINGYCRARYTVPFSTTPPMVELIAIDLACWHLYRRRHYAFGMPEAITANYERRLKQLEAINKGLLDVGSEPAPSASTKLYATSEGPEQEFTGGDDGTLRDF